jgi:hypothetical protein
MGARAWVKCSLRKARLRGGPIAASFARVREFWRRKLRQAKTKVQMLRDAEKQIAGEKAVRIRNHAPRLGCDLVFSMLAFKTLEIVERRKTSMESTERRAQRRFTMSLPLTVRLNGPAGPVERTAQTRDISFRGLYFVADEEYAPGISIEFVLTLPSEITQAGDVSIRCYGEVVRVESYDSRNGIAARIERYEFLPTAA